jgi:hypothetical protein
VEKDLFEQTRYKDIEDNLTSEKRKALTEFRSVSVEDRDWIIRMQDKGNNFVILNKNLD